VGQKPKKAIFWWYKLEAAIASSSNYLDPAGEPSFPDIREIKLSEAARIQHLAAIAGLSKGIRGVHTRIEFR
jgi:hypothetical protein